MKKLFFIIFLISITFNVLSQDFNHEIGVSLGAVSIQSDYKERDNDLVGAYRNVGFITGVSYYLSFNSDYKRWNDKTVFLKNHFRLKLDANYTQNKFVHRGKSIDLNYNAEAVKMASMKGSTKIYSFGAHVEYLIFDSYYDKKFEPYLVAGFYYNIYDPEIETELGDWKDNPNLLPTEFLNEANNVELSNSPSFSFGVGSRYNVGNVTLFFEIKAQKFMSDTIEGLDPQTGENKNKDWLSSAQVGIVFKLN